MTTRETSYRSQPAVAQILDLLGIDDVPRVVFARSPLVLALCQIRFPVILSVADEAFVGQFQRRIREEYPVANQAKEVGLLIGGLAPEPVVREQYRGFNWRFGDREENWRVVLAKDFLAFEARAYAEFDEYLERLTRIVSVFDELFQPEIVTRVGLRYVNEVSLEGRTAAEVVRQDLLGPLKVPEFDTYASVALQQVLLRYPSEAAELGVNINHGRLPEGTTVELRPGVAPPDRPFYLLDLDVFCDFSRPPGLTMDTQVIRENVEMAHRVIYRLFRWALTDEYVASLGVRGHGAA